MDINISFQLATADAAGDEHLCPHLNQNRVITHPLELEATDGHRYEFWYQPRTMRFKCYDEDDKTYFDAYCLPVTNTTYTCEGTVYTIRKHPGPKPVTIVNSVPTAAADPQPTEEEDDSDEEIARVLDFGDEKPVPKVSAAFSAMIRKASERLNNRTEEEVRKHAEDAAVVLKVLRREGYVKDRHPSTPARNPSNTTTSSADEGPSSAETEAEDGAEDDFAGLEDFTMGTGSRGNIN